MQHLISIKAKIKRSNVNAFKGDFFFFLTLKCISLSGIFVLHVANLSILFILIIILAATHRFFSKYTYKIFEKYLKLNAIYILIP